MARWSINNFLESHCLEQSTRGQEKSLKSLFLMAGDRLRLLVAILLLFFLLESRGVVEPGQWCLEGGRYQEPRTVTWQY